MQKIKINLYIPDIALKTISVPLQCRVSSLKKFVPTNYDIFLHQGCEVPGAITFANSGIKNLDTLVVIPSNTQSGTNWAKLSSDSFFTDKVKYSAIPSNKMELARLRDLRFFQIERKNRRYSKLVNKYNNCIFSRGENDNQSAFETVIPDRLDEIPIDPLPAMWDTDKTCVNVCSPLPMPDITQELYSRSISVESQA